MMPAIWLLAVVANGGAFILAETATEHLVLGALFLFSLGNFFISYLRSLRSERR